MEKYGNAMKASVYDLPMYEECMNLITKLTVLYKVHLTPNFFFFAQINLHIMLSKSPQKFFDLLESLIFYAS